MHWMPRALPLSLGKAFIAAPQGMRVGCFDTELITTRESMMTRNRADHRSSITATILPLQLFPVTPGHFMCRR